MSGQLQLRMANCPSMVQGARTTMIPTKRGVALTIIGAGPEVESKIRRLARYQAEVVAAAPNRETHTGRGTGGGRMGYCPIVHPGTRVEVQDIPAGVRVTVQARKKKHVERLQRLTAQRVNALPPQQQRAEPAPQPVPQATPVEP